MLYCASSAPPFSCAQWAVPPAHPHLSRDEVHVWRASRDVTKGQIALLERTLTGSEVERAGRFRQERDRERFVAGRGNLRVILSRYTGIAPQQLRLTYNAFGKPLLALMPGQEPLWFNLAHSGEIVLYAVARGRRVGIDIERVEDDLDVEQIARYAFSAAERRMIASLPESQRRAAFYACWTRKEAYLKARGQGLSWPLDQFDVSVAPQGLARLLCTRWDAREADRWSLQALLPGPGYVAALAAEGLGWHMRCWTRSQKLEGRDA